MSSVTVGDAPTPETTDAPAPLAQRFRAAAGACAVFVVAVAATVLVGWSVGNETLKSVVPGLTPMNPLTAVTFALAGATLWVARRQPSSPAARRLVVALGAAVVLPCASRMIASFTRFDLGWDAVLFWRSLGGNRQAPNTATCLALAGLALATIDLRWPRTFRLAEALALTAGFIAAVALAGYAYSDRALYGIPQFNPMALHAAAAMLVLCAGIACARPDGGAMAVVTGDDMGGLLVRRMLVIAVVAPVGLEWARLVGVRRGYLQDELSASLYVVILAVLFGTVVWANARLFRRVDAFRRRAQEKVRRAELRYRAVVEQTREGIYLLDAQTKRVVECNAAFAELLGYSPEEAARLCAYDFVFHARESVDERIAEVLRLGHAASGERQYRRRDGSAVDVQADASLINYDGQSFLCTVVHDITRRKRNEREIREKNQQLEAASESVRAALEAQGHALAAEREAMAQLKRTQSHLVQTEKLAGLGQMVAGVAHEINNPLSFVSNNVVVLQRDSAAVRRVLQLYQQADAAVAASAPDLMEEIRDLSEQIDLEYTLKNADDLMVRSREGLRRIQQIVKDLRDFARLDESDVHEIDLNAGIESTVNIIRGNAKRRQVQIETALRPMPPFACYPAKVNQVVMNLLSNAVDASPENTIVVVRTRPLDGDAAGGKGGVEIEVEDHGTGIPPEVAARIFDPFFTTKPPGQGTGLGLSISYGIVQDHGGTIAVRSEVGVGTCFTVRLPARGKAER